MSQAPDLTLETGLPANVDAEKTILGAVLLDNAAFAEAAERLQAEDFSLDSHRRIFLRMSYLSDTYRAIDIVTLANELNRNKEVESVGGVAYLASLTEGLPRRPVVAEYIRIVKDKALLRRMMLICSNTIARSADQSEDAIGIGMAALTQLETVVSVGMAESTQRAGDFMDKSFPTPETMIDHPARSTGIMSGFREVDEMTCGFQQGDLIVLAARPSMGKSSIAWNIAEHVAVNCETPMMFLPLETGKKNLLNRGVCSRARVPYQSFRKGTMTEIMKADFGDAYEEIKRAPLFVDEHARTIPAIRIQALKLKSRGMLFMIVIDQLNFIETPTDSHGGRRGLSREQEVAGYTRSLKNLARELNVPIIVLHHLSRAVTKRTDNRPNLADLRESGALEQDADVVAFIHRPEYYDRTDEALKGKAELIIAKQRDGPTDTCNINFDPSILRFSDPFDPKDLQTEIDYWSRG
jgi:replicative DNA helicase